MEKDKIFALLQNSELFKDLSKSSLQILREGCAIVTIMSGEIVFEEGDPPNAMYLVMHGRLGIKRKHGEAPDIIKIGEVEAGEFIGEFALLTKEPRAATVFAIRDSTLLCLTSEAFYRFMSHSPQEASLIWRFALLRSIHSNKNKMFSLVSTMMFYSQNESVNAMESMKLFAKELSAYGSVLYLNKVILGRMLQIDEDLTETEKERRTTAWLSEQELNYRYIIYEANIQDVSWTNRCFRQADSVIFFAESVEDPRFEELERTIFLKAKEFQKDVHLALLQPATKVLPVGTKKWLELRPNIFTHHVQIGTAGNMQRFVRSVIGNSTGLVLAGGGCRCYGHVGVYKALCELKIPIDFIAGTSAGAFFGALIAANYSPDEIIKIIKGKVIPAGRRIKRYTFPLLSLFSGAGLEGMLKDIFGEELSVENLWVPFFAVACNLSNNSVEILDLGPVWEVIRTTASLPAVFPPVGNEKGEFLIDGGILNNLPVDLIKTRMPRGKIIASGFTSENPMEFIYKEGAISGWEILKNYALKRVGISFPTIIDMIYKSVSVASDKHAHLMASKADIFIEVECGRTSIFDFHAIDQMVEFGYRSTMDKSEQLMALLTPTNNMR